MMMIVKRMSLFATLLVASGLIACSGAFADMPEEEEPAAVPAEEEQEDDSELESMRGLADQQLSIGELRHFNARHISRIIIEDFAVVQVEPFGDGRQLSMTGVATGETNIQIFFGDDEVYDVSVRVVSEGVILEPDQV